MDNYSISIIQAATVFALPVIFAITLHEAAHGYVARLLGDNTAYMMGRVSCNPVQHIDLIWTIVIPIATYFFTGGKFIFGCAKPVPVTFSNLNHPRWGGLLVALAGPACNFVQAFVWGVLAVLIFPALGINESFFIQMANAGISINLVFGVFNLFPLPPLDGGRILSIFLPLRQAIVLSYIESYSLIILMILTILGTINQFWINPLVSLCYKVMNIILTF
ncbi:MAG: site-2 protease family protein [Burkholderia sp.]|nr:site-2 protease family protein [Burkholderia sp.]